MSEPWFLAEARIRQIELFFPLSLAIPQVDDLCIVAGVIGVIRNGPRWRDTLPASRPHEAIFHCSIR